MVGTLISESFFFDMDIHGRDKDNDVTPFELLDRDHEPRQFLSTVWQNKDHVLHSDITTLFHILKRI